MFLLTRKIWALLFAVFYMQTGIAQKVSVDGAVIRNSTQNLSGINTAVFYHFTERLSGGIELTGFFSKTFVRKPESIKRSAWDLDINFHYDLIRFNKLSIYPIAGVGYNEVREKNQLLAEPENEKFWAINSGAGIRLDAGFIKPHLEYTAVWLNGLEHLILAGISIEFGSGKEK